MQTLRLLIRSIRNIPLVIEYRMVRWSYRANEATGRYDAKTHKQFIDVTRRMRERGLTVHDPPASR